MDAIPIHGVPLPPTSIGHPQWNQNGNNPGARKRPSEKRPLETSGTDGDADETSETNSDDPEQQRRNSDGILGTIIDIEA
jgi:hypothetical protein